MKYDNILEFANNYNEMCNSHFIKVAFIRKLPNGEYRVVSHSGKNLGTYKSKDDAEKRLKQVEYFKHKDNNAADDEIIDLTDLDELSYSALLRKLRKKVPKECVHEFLHIYQDQFNKAIKNNLQKPESIAMQNALVIFNKDHKIRLNKDIVKNAAVTELGDPRYVGKYLSDIIRFTLTRIDPAKRAGAIATLKRKIYNLNENEISSKNLPPSSSMGQSITFVKHVLFNHNARYIRAVLNNIVRSL